MPITVFALDAENRRVPTAEVSVAFTLDGPARIIGVGNGDPTSHAPNRAMSVPLFRGLAQVIVQTTTTPGAIALTASASGLTPATLKLESTASHPPRPTLPPARRKFFVTDWRMSPITADRPDPRQVALAQDMNSWERVEPGKPQAQWERAPSPAYAIYRATFTPPKSIQARGGRLVFHEVAGSAEIFVGDTMAATNSAASPARMEAVLPPSPSPVTVSVLVRGDAPAAGLSGRVELLPPA